MNYYIQGDAANADKIKAAFKKLGYDVTGFDMCNDNILFFTYKLQTGANVISTTNAHLYTANIIKTHPDYKELELPVEPKFKVGDSLQSGSGFTKILSINLEEGRYYCDNRIISFENQDLWHLVPKPHYDIANFKPFDKVLVRCADDEGWAIEMFSKYYDSEPTIHGRTYRFMCIADSYTQCIPFEGNEHLLGTTDMPSEEFINW